MSIPDLPTSVTTADVSKSAKSSSEAHIVAAKKAIFLKRACSIPPDGTKSANDENKKAESPSPAPKESNKEAATG